MRLSKRTAVKKITLNKDSYWKLKEIKAVLRCGTWEELIERLYTFTKEGKLD